MKKPFQLFVAGTVSLIALTGGIAGFCALQIFRCTIGTDFAWSEAIGPLSIVFLGLCFMSGLILFGAVCVVKVAMRWRQPLRGFSMLLGGVLAGCFPRFFWEILTGVFPDTFYLHMEYAPFAIAGMFSVATLLLTGFQKVQQTPS